MHPAAIHEGAPVSDRKVDTEPSVDIALTVAAFRTERAGEHAGREPSSRKLPKHVLAPELVATDDVRRIEVRDGE
jgi:hypothetical protein